MDTLNKLRSELRQRDLIVVSDGNDLVDYCVRLVDLCRICIWILLVGTSKHETSKEDIAMFNYKTKMEWEK